MGMTIRFNLRRALTSLENKENRRITMTSFAGRTGCAKSTLYGYMNNKVTRLDLVSVAKILNYFRSQGLEYTMDDLFEVTYEEKEEE